MRDQDKAGSDLFFHPLEQVHDIGLGQHVQGGGRLVQDHQVGHRHQRHGDGHPLAHPAAQLEGVAVDKIDRHAHPLEHRLGVVQGGFFAHPMMHHHRLGDLVAHPQHRIERVHRRLRHHRHLHPAHVPAELLFVQGHHIHAIQVNTPRIGVYVAGEQAQ